jgi:hypothetical protein
MELVGGSLADLNVLLTLVLGRTGAKMLELRGNRLTSSSRLRRLKKQK